MKRLTHNSFRVMTASLVTLILLVISVASPNSSQVIAQGPINFGETVSGSINTPGEIDTFTFSAYAGDMIFIGMSRVSGDLWQRIRLYDPAGNLLRDEHSPVHVEISQSLPDRYYIYLPMIVGDDASASAKDIGSGGLHIQADTPGTYTILVSDGFDGTLTGSYSLYVQRLNEPGDAASISFSQTRSGAIDQPAEMDTWTFSANAGDTILVGMSRISGDLWQQIRLYDSDGILLGEESSPVHTELVYTVPATSDYALLVADGFNGTSTGSYNLYTQRLNNPTNAIALSFGQTVSGDIAQPGEMDAYTFNADAGDTILLGMSRVSGDLWQEIRLYDPNGSLLNEESSAVHVENVFTVPNSGEYRVLLADGFDGTNTGSYNLYIQRLNNPSDASSLSFGQTVSGDITQPAEMDAFTFNADAGDTILLGMGRVSGDLWQEIRLYDPNGTLLNEESSPVHVENVYTVPNSGEYRVLLADGFNGTNTGSYNLYIQRLNNPSDASSISFGQTLPGSITQPAEMDTYVFSATADDTVLIGMTRTSGSLWPQIRIYDPSGNLLGEDSAAIQAEITQALPATGNYTILASDGFTGILTGDYNLNLQQLP